MMRNIISIDESLCNGCGLCVHACHEGALMLVGGKARLVSDSYCDGLGDCLPECPTGAITITRREAAGFDKELVQRRLNATGNKLLRPDAPAPGAAASAPEEAPASLQTWPVQLALVSARAEYLRDAHLLISADCAAYASSEFHTRFLPGRVPLIGCPKLDHEDYAAKLTAILRENNIRSITVLRMEVPCCAGIVRAVEQAVAACGKAVPWSTHTLSTTGAVLEEAHL